MNELHTKILRHLSDGKECTLSELQEVSGLNKDDCLRFLYEMTDDELIGYDDRSWNVRWFFIQHKGLYALKRDDRWG